LEPAASPEPSLTDVVGSEPGRPAKNGVFPEKNTVFTGLVTASPTWGCTVAVARRRDSLSVEKVIRDLFHLIDRRKRRGFPGAMACASC
jgi:hypothetical protein